MFCQKCGKQNPDNGRFCRACGTDLGSNSSPAGNFIQPIQPIQPMFYPGGEQTKSNDPDELWSSGIQSLITGVGFLIMAMVLLTTGVAGGRFWWWTMLFPAFPALGNGISKISKSKRIARRNSAAGVQMPNQNQMPKLQPHQSIDSTRENLLLIEQMIRGGRKIEAIRIHRETFGSDLREAKVAVERIAEGSGKSNFQPPYEPAPPQKSIYDTGDLAAPTSVTEGTTRHLEFNDEGETMTLPPNNK